MEYDHFNEEYLQKSFSSSQDLQKTTYLSPQNITHMPAEWLMQRIYEVLNAADPSQLTLPVFNDTDNFGKLITEFQLSEAESVVVCLALSITYMPEVLQQLAKAVRVDEFRNFTGGFFQKGIGSFRPTIRTAVFLLSGKDPEKTAYYTSYFHRNLTVFTAGIVTTEPLYMPSVFMDYQLIFNDQYLATILLGEAPRLDGDAGFPVKCSKARHLLSDLILKRYIDENTLKEKLQEKTDEQTDEPERDKETEEEKDLPFDWDMFRKKLNVLKSGTSMNDKKLDLIVKKLKAVENIRIKEFLVKSMVMHIDSAIGDNIKLKGLSELISQTLQMPKNTSTQFFLTQTFERGNALLLEGKSIIFEPDNYNGAVDILIMDNGKATQLIQLKALTGESVSSTINDAVKKLHQLESPVAKKVEICLLNLDQDQFSKSIESLKTHNQNKNVDIFIRYKDSNEYMNLNSL